MNLDFEKWARAQEFHPRIIELFEESIKAYKASAYKAALLFSYLGFASTLKDRIFKGKCPAGIDEQLWNHIKARISQDEVWDFQVFEATQRKSPAPIFAISESLRREISYWKDRRNDCAHSKNETISYHHVESFWAFLKRNLPKLVINGGASALLEKFIDHFDYSKTQPGKDFSLYVIEIESSVEENVLTSFFADIRKLPNENDSLEVYSKVFEMCSASVIDQLLIYLKSDFNLQLTFMNNYPALIPRLKLDATQIREIWYSKLFTTFYNPLPIFCSFLRNSLIPETDITEAVTHMVKNCTNKPTSYEYQILIENGYNDIFYKQYFTGDHYLGYWRTINDIRSQIIYFLEQNKIDKNIAGSICKSFEKAYPPKHLGTSLQDFFQRNNEKREEFIKATDENNIVIPTALSFITNSSL